jgi:hypothetical protein
MPDEMRDGLDVETAGRQQRLERMAQFAGCPSSRVEPTVTIPRAPVVLSPFCCRVTRSIFGAAGLVIMNRICDVADGPVLTLVGDAA